MNHSMFTKKNSRLDTNKQRLELPPSNETLVTLKPPRRFSLKLFSDKHAKKKRTPKSRHSFTQFCLKKSFVYEFIPSVKNRLSQKPGKGGSVKF